MKRLAILILAFAIIIPAGMAQEKQRKRLLKENLPSPILEVWGGMGMSTVTGNIASAKNRLTGLFGVGFSLPISDLNHLHFEAGYSFQGFNYKPQTYQIDDTTSIELDNADQRFNYFILTAQDKYFFDKNRTYYVNGGFYLSYLSHARFQANYQVQVEGEQDEHNEIDDGNKDDLTAFDFGITGGAGVRLGNKSYSGFSIELRTAYGLVNVFKPMESSDNIGHNFYVILKLGFDIPVNPQ